MAPKVALVAGVTGIIGMNLAKRLIKENGKVYGLSRRKPDYLPKVCIHFHLIAENILPDRYSVNASTAS